MAGDGEEAAVQGAMQVPVVGADGVVDGDEIGAGGKRAFDLNFVKGVAYVGVYVPAAEHGGAHGHEVCDGVVSIADEFVDVVCDECLVRMLVDISPWFGWWVGGFVEVGDCDSGQSKVHTVASVWFNLIPLASLLCASSPTCEMTSLSSWIERSKRVGVLAVCRATVV